MVNTAKQARSRNGLVVVIVEDEPLLQEVYRLQLGKLDIPIELVTASDGNEGREKILQLRPDLVIADLSMPGKDGFQMIREVKRDPGLDHTHIVAVTGMDWPDISDHGGLPEDVLVYEKPVPFVEIEALLRDRLLHVAGLPG